MSSTHGISTAKNNFKNDRFVGSGKHEMSSTAASTQQESSKYFVYIYCV